MYLLRSAGPRSPWLLFAVGAGLCALSAVAHHPIDRMEPVHHSVRYRHARRDAGDGRSRLVPGKPEPHVSIPPLDPTARPGCGSLSDSRLPGVWRTHSGRTVPATSVVEGDGASATNHVLVRS